MVQDCYLQAELQNDIQDNQVGGEKEVNNIGGISLSSEKCKLLFDGEFSLLIMYPNTFE